MSRKPAPFSQTPLGILTAPVATPRLPADAPARPYRPKISAANRPKPKAQKPAPKAKAPTRSTPLAVLTRPVPQLGPPSIRAAASHYRATLESEARKAAAKSAAKGDALGHVLPVGGHRRGASVPPDLFNKGQRRYDPSVRSSDQLLADVAFFHLPPAKQSATAWHYIKAQPHEESLAPVTKKILDVATRPVNFTAGAASAALSGQNVLKGAKKSGLGHGKDRKLFGDVLKEHGVKGPVGAVLGFALDVGLDPTTYISLGTTSVARETAVKVAARTAKEAEATALRAGATKAIAKERGRAAAHAAFGQSIKGAESGPARHLTRGLDVRFAGKRAPGITRATAQAGRGAKSVKAGAERITPSGARRVAADTRKAFRNAGSELNANVRAASVSAEQQSTVKAIQRETRAQAERNTRYIHERVNALTRRLDPEERQQVIDAIEAGTVKALKGRAAPLRATKREPLRALKGGTQDPDRLYVIAKRVQADLTYLHRVGRRSGTITGTVGVGRRSRFEQASLANPGAGVRSRAKVQAALDQAGKDLAAAHRVYRDAATPGARIAARRNVTAARQRFENLSAQRHGIQGQEAGAAARRAGQRAARASRKGDAKGYFPRVSETELQKGGLLAHLAAPLHADLPTVGERIGSNKPEINAGQKRQYLQSRADLAANPDTAHVVKNLSNDVRGTLAQYGASVARGGASRDMNLKLVQQLGTPVPAGITPAKMAELTRNGFSAYRVRGGTLEKLDPDHAFRTIEAASRGKAGANAVTRKTITKGPRAGQVETSVERRATGGQVAIIKDEAVAHARNRMPGAGASDYRVLRVWDKGLGIFKAVALTTPQYLVRNLVGDTHNAWTDENFWRLLRNQARGQKVLGAVGRKERAARRFGTSRGHASLDPDEIGRYKDAMHRLRDALPGDRHTVHLTEQQAIQIAKALGLPAEQVSRKMNAGAIAMLAERVGVIRQGRFLDVLGEGKKLSSPAGSSAWRDVAKRVEDSTRIATFLGGLHRGLDLREAAQRASNLHFDYGDLTPIERDGFRRLAPFYTFSARNIPLQAKTLVKRPGKFAAVAKARQEGLNATGLPSDLDQRQSPFEARQLGVPVKFQGKTYTVSMGLPFVDLNDVAATVGNLATGHPIKAADAAIQKAEEQLGPYKTPLELQQNYSQFYRDKIAPDHEPLTRAPAWAIKLAKRDPAAGRALGLKSTYLAADGTKQEWGWSRKLDYAGRNLTPGAIGPLIDLVGGGVKGPNARDMSKSQRLLAAFGLRAIQFDKNKGELTKLYTEKDQLQNKIDLQRRLAGGVDPTLRTGVDNPTPEFTRLNDRLSVVSTRIDELARLTRPGGLVAGERVTTGTATGRLPKTASLPSGGARLPSTARLSSGGGARLPR